MFRPAMENRGMIHLCMIYMKLATLTPVGKTLNIATKCFMGKHTKVNIELNSVHILKDKYPALRRVITLMYRLRYVVYDVISGPQINESCRNN